MAELDPMFCVSAVRYMFYTCPVYVRLDQVVTYNPRSPMTDL